MIRLITSCIVLVALAGCAEDVMVPRDISEEALGGAPLLAMQLDCAVDLRAGGNLQCAPAPVTAGGAGQSMNLVVGSQHQFVRMGNAVPTADATTWSAAITVQNLTLQPMGTLDGAIARTGGVRVFFVSAPTNGVEVANADGADTFTGSAQQLYYQYSGTADLGGDGILSPGETSAPKTWQFTLNGASEFQFRVLIWTEVPEPDAYSVRLTRISAGNAHTCGDGTDDNVYCWGDNNYFQLGDGTYTNRSTPVTVIAPAGVTLSAVSVGAQHSCAEGSDGKIYCWGDSYNGQLGNGTTTSAKIPVAVSAPEGVTLSSVSAGPFHTCAAGSDGELYCWGDNYDGQVGDGTTDNIRRTPVAVSVPADVTLSGVSAGNHHTCAAGSDGELYCWGYNSAGQLGDGTTASHSTPVAVSTPADVTLSGVSAGAFHSCAAGSDGKLYCWGQNAEGQLGTGIGSRIPMAVNAPGGVALSGVSAGRFHTCARGSDGKLYCWGSNDSGRLGDGTTNNRSTPVSVSAPTEITLSGVLAGGLHTCALSMAGPVWCWGANGSGGLGDGRTTNSSVPVIVAGTR